MVKRHTPKNTQSETRKVTTEARRVVQGLADAPPPDKATSDATPMGHQPRPTRAELEKLADKLIVRRRQRLKSRP